MKEIHEFRLYKKYAHLLLKEGEGIDNGFNIVVFINRDDTKFEQIKLLTQMIKENFNESPFLYSNIKRKYSKKELDSALVLQVKIKTTFEPAGEECGTIYDETTSCKICGAGSKQIGPLILNKASLLNKDIARTIAGEIVLSERFVDSYFQRGLTGASFQQVIFTKGSSNYYQLTSAPEINLSKKTLAGVNIFDFSEGSENTELTVSSGYKIKLKKEVYKCPKGHTIGLNILSEAFVLSDPLIQRNDFLVSKQKIGVRRGLLRPEPLYLCSAKFRQMVIEEKLSGFEFEVAHIE